MTEISDELKGICTQTKVPDASVKWLGEQEVVEPIDLALLARTEDLVVDNIMTPAGINADTIKNKVSITKAWWLARGIADKRAAVNSGYKFNWLVQPRIFSKP